MTVESLLRLGELDPGLREPEVPLDIRGFAGLARVLSLVPKAGLARSEAQ